MCLQPRFCLFWSFVSKCLCRSRTTIGRKRPGCLQLMQQQGGKDYMRTREAVLDGLGLVCSNAKVVTGPHEGSTLHDLQASELESVRNAAQAAEAKLKAFIGERIISNTTVCRTASAARFVCRSQFYNQHTVSALLQCGIKRHTDGTLKCSAKRSAAKTVPWHRHYVLTLVAPPLSWTSYAATLMRPMNLMRVCSASA